MRGSGGTDPGVRTVVKNFYDDARIREYGSGRQNHCQEILMVTRGSGSTDPGVRTAVKKLPVATRGSGSTDPGVTHFSETCILNFISGSIPDAWVQKHVAVSVKS
jgi:hypothetical protein